MKNGSDEWYNKFCDFFSFFYVPSKPVKIGLLLVPFAVAIYFYGSTAIERHAENPDDKFMPYATQMYESAKAYVTEEDPRSGEIEFVTDTLASLRRFGIGVATFSLFALFFGVMFGALPWIKSIGSPFIMAVSIIPPLAVTPILFIALGVEETGKIMLIVLGNVFLMTRDIERLTSDIPNEHYIKAMTLGFGKLAILRKIVLPQVMPRFWETVRIYLSPAWLYLIAAEFTAAQYGLACRILMLKRYQAMDLIIPIVLWITVIGVIFNVLIQGWIRFRYPWFVAAKKK